MVKACLLSLMVFALLLIPLPSHGQATSTPSPDQNGNTGGESAIAADPGPAMPAVDLPGPDMQFPVLRTLGGMGVVLCLMVTAFFAVRKFAPRYFNKPASERNLKIVETLQMGDRRSISLVEVGNNRFLIGNTPHQINLLAALPEAVSLMSEPDVAAATPKSMGKKESRTPFRNLFEIEKSRPVQYAVNPLPEDLRAKMRQLREALERS